MDSELLLKFIRYFPDYLSALSRTLFFFFGQPLSKQLYTKVAVCYGASLVSSLFFPIELPKIPRARDYSL